jgi:hypothetical protein
MHYEPTNVSPYHHYNDSPQVRLEAHKLAAKIIAEMKGLEEAKDELRIWASTQSGGISQENADKLKVLFAKPEGRILESHG